MKKVIGVMGSSHGKITKKALELSYQCGKLIAERGYVLLTGGSLGIGQAAARGAKEAGGITLAISPGINYSEHIEKYDLSSDSDIYVYTGLGNMGRNVFNIRSSDGLVFINGGIGTLNEMTIAYAEGKPFGVLTESSGISDHIEDIISKTGKKQKAVVIFDHSINSLFDKLEKEL